MTISLSPRLQKIADAVVKDAKIIDVGTDHAYLPVYLVLKGQVSEAIAGDVTVGPYESARSTVRKYGLDKQVSVRLGDGLSVVAPGEVDTAIVAGMGGATIRDILAAAPSVVAQLQHLILQPMNAEQAVREDLYQQGIAIANETIVREGDRYYTIIVAKRSPNATKQYESYVDDPVALSVAFEFGPLILAQRTPDEDTLRYIILSKKHLLAIADKISRSDQPQVQARHETLMKKVAYLTRWLEMHQTPEV